MTKNINTCFEFITIQSDFKFIKYKYSQAYKLTKL